MELQANHAAVSRVFLYFLDDSVINHTGVLITEMIGSRETAAMAGRDGMIHVYLATPCMARGCWLLPLVLCASTVIAAPDDEPAETDVVTVIGSHIAQVDVAGASPALVMDSQSIESAGSLYLSEVLQQLPLDNNSTFNDRDPLSSALGGAAPVRYGLRRVGVS